jgi:hypothetical protein
LSYIESVKAEIKNLNILILALSRKEDTDKLAAEVARQKG